MKKLLLTIAGLALTAGAWAASYNSRFPATPEGNDDSYTVNLSQKNFQFSKYTLEDAANVTSTLFPTELIPGEQFNLGENYLSGKIDYNTNPEYKDGVICYSAGGFITATLTRQSSNITSFEKGVSIYDFGGKIGKVLVINGYNSNLANAIKEPLNLDVAPEISTVDRNMTAAFGYNWILNKELLDEAANPQQNGTVKIRMEINVYNPADKDVINTISRVNNIKNAVNGNPAVINSSSFRKYTNDSARGEEELGDVVEGSWNPYRWMVYDIEFRREAGDALQNCLSALKMQFIGSALNGPNENEGSAVLIRSVEMYFCPDNIEGIDSGGKTNITWRDYTPDDDDTEVTPGPGTDPDPDPDPEPQYPTVNPGTDITPANYKFNDDGVLPIHPVGKINDVNLGKGAWSAFNCADYWNDGLLLVSSGGGLTDAQHDGFINSWNYIDFGGEVGRVACYINQGSSAKKDLQKLNSTENWESLNQNTAVFGGGALNIYLDPKNTPTTGYIHAKIVFNVDDLNEEKSGIIFQNINVRDDSNNNIIMWNGTSYPSDPIGGEKVNVLKNEFTTDGAWDPTKWMTYEFDFAVADNGLKELPLRLKMFYQAGQSNTSTALFIKEISFTHVEDADPTMMGTVYQKIETLEIGEPKIDLIPGAIFDKISNITLSHPQTDEVLELSGSEQAKIAVAITTLSNGKYNPEGFTVDIENNESELVEASDLSDGVIVVKIADNANKNENLVNIKVKSGDLESNTIKVQHYAAPKSVKLSHESLEITENNEIGMAEDDDVAEFEVSVVDAQDSKDAVYQKFILELEDTPAVASRADGDDVAEIKLNEDGDKIVITPKKIGSVTFSVTPYLAGEHKSDSTPSGAGKTLYTVAVGASGVEIINVTTGEVEYYDLQGRKVQNPDKGLYIKKQGDKTTKVIL